MTKIQNNVFGSFEFGILNLFRISNLGFRICILSRWLVDPFLKLFQGQPVKKDPQTDYIYDIPNKDVREVARCEGPCEAHTMKQRGQFCDPHPVGP